MPSTAQVCTGQSPSRPACTATATPGEIRCVTVYDGDQGGGLVRGDEGRHDDQIGVWLALEGGTKLFLPICAAVEEIRRWPDPEAGLVEEADETTLEAACRLMPLLPRELIAERLRLGRHRRGSGNA